MSKTTCAASATRNSKKDILSSRHFGSTISFIIGRTPLPLTHQPPLSSSSSHSSLLSVPYTGPKVTTAKTMPNNAMAISVDHLIPLSTGSPLLGTNLLKPFGFSAQNTSKDQPSASSKTLSQVEISTPKTVAFGLFHFCTLCLGTRDSVQTNLGASSCVYGTVL